MAYEYRDVKCYDCGHVFMWSKDFEWPYNQAYIINDTGEIIFTAKCPKCDKKMYVLPHRIDGVEVIEADIGAVEISFE